MHCTQYIVSVNIKQDGGVKDVYASSFGEPHKVLPVAVIKSNTTSIDTFTLVIVRCTGNLTWLVDVPKDWKIVIYEKCLSLTEPISQNSIATAMNEGAEECNGYLDYIVDYYHNLTSVTVFMHDDGLAPWSKWKGESAHTPFISFTDLAHAVTTHLTKNQGFVQLGVSRINESWGTNGYHGLAQKVLWPYIRSDQYPNPPEIIAFKPSAHMAVRQEQIQLRSQGTYEAMLQQVRYTNSVPNHLDARQMCCALERSWHMLFGEPPELSLKADLLHQLNAALE